MPALEEVLDSPAPAGVRIIAKGFLDEWVTALPRLRAGTDDEALHDYRVALRKLRSWLKTFDVGGGKAMKQLSALQEDTGGARDTEVMVEWLQGDPSEAATWAIERLKNAERVDVERVDARTQKTATRLDKKLSSYSLEVPLAANAPVVPFSWAYAAALRRLHNDLNEAALAVGSDEDPEALHRVRIRAKRLRYALAPLKEWPEAAEAMKLLKERQDVLGELNDRATFCAQLETLALDRPVPPLVQGLIELLARATHEQHERYAKYALHRHEHDVRLAALVDVVCERLGKRMGLSVEVVPGNGS